MDRATDRSRISQRYQQGYLRVATGTAAAALSESQVCPLVDRATDCHRISQRHRQGDLRVAYGTAAADHPEKAGFSINGQSHRLASDQPLAISQGYVRVASDTAAAARAEKAGLSINGQRHHLATDQPSPVIRPGSNRHGSSRSLRKIDSSIKGQSMGQVRSRHRQ